MKKIILSLALILTTSIVYADIALPPSSSDHSKAVSKMDERKALREQRMAEMKAQAEKVRVACEADIAKTGCKEGPAMMKCVGDYKRKNKDFAFSEGCTTAMQERTNMRRNSIIESRKARKIHHEKKQASPVSADATK